MESLQLDLRNDIEQGDTGNIALDSNHAEKVIKVTKNVTSPEPTNNHPQKITDNDTDDFEYERQESVYDNNDTERGSLPPFLIHSPGDVAAKRKALVNNVSLESQVAVKQDVAARQDVAAKRKALVNNVPFESQVSSSANGDEPSLVSSETSNDLAKSEKMTKGVSNRMSCKPGKPVNELVSMWEHLDAAKSGKSM